jgi:TolB protein
MNVDGTGQRRLTFNMGKVNSPSWSPDGEWILFNSDRMGNFDLYVMRPDGSDIHQLTINPADDYNGVWQP